MKRIALLLIICLFLCACGMNKDAEVKETDIITETPTEVPTDTPIPTEEPSEFTEIKVGDTINLDFVTFTIESVDEAKEIHFDDSYYYLEDDTTYFYVKGTMKNISGSEFFAKPACTKLIFDDQYTYSAYAVTQYGENLILQPFEAETVYVSYAVPDELINSYKSCEIQIGFIENMESITDDIDLCDYKYCIKKTK